MNRRERFRETILFGKPDRIPLMPGEPRESTLARWHQEGLPKDRHYFTVLMETLGYPDEKPTEAMIDTGVSFKTIPPFEDKIIEHREGHYIVQDRTGAIVEISDQFDLTYLRSSKDFVTRKWHKFPVENESDWEKMASRFDPRSPGRYPEDFLAKCKTWQDDDAVLSVNFNGPFWQLREWLGFENLCLMMIEKPGFIKELVSFWTEFVLQTMAPLLDKVRVDRFYIMEDMAFKLHSMISPRMVREFLCPAYQSWIPVMKRNNPRAVIEMDSDGFIEELIPIWIEIGFNCCYPMEVAAGNEIVKCREKFGAKMAYRGGIDKRAIAEGGKVIEEEVLRVAPPLMREGGFIPSCDHGVPPDVSWPNFVKYTRLLAELSGWL